MMSSFDRLTLTRPAALAAMLVVSVLGTAALTLPRPALAQEIVLSANGDPITTLDIEQREKLLRAMRRPASRDAAIESMIEDRLKYREAARFGIVIKDNEIGEEVQTIAKRLHTSPTGLMQAMARSGVSPDHIRGYFKAQYGFAILVRALNRGVEASEIAVRSEMEKERNKGEITSYTIRQIVFTVNPGDPPSVLEASVRQAQALRAKFTSCETGIPYAKNLPGVAVRAKLTRTASQLTDPIKELLDKTPTGHLTEPSRSPNGIELVAVCEKSAERDQDELRKEISERLLAQHYAEEEVTKYKELRASAVITRNP
jgi:peptidyl-prolyl cis-trans isomerase SurA